jgi:hypothetical protein
VAIYKRSESKILVGRPGGKSNERDQRIDRKITLKCGLHELLGIS